jgi:hypothetical protein
MGFFIFHHGQGAAGIHNWGLTCAATAGPARLAERDPRRVAEVLEFDDAALQELQDDGDQKRQSRHESARHHIFRFQEANEEKYEQESQQRFSQVGNPQDVGDRKAKEQREKRGHDNRRLASGL